MNRNPMQDAVDAALGNMIQVMVPILILMVLLTVLSWVLKAMVRSGRRGGRGRNDRTAVATAQVEVVRASRFELKPLLNREEERLLPVLERAAEEIGRGHRVMAQISLGEVIRPVKGSRPEAMSAINSKRIDMGIFDRRGFLICAVEYQGTGHWRNNASLRDTVKREALRKAGVEVLEVFPDFDEEDVERSVLDLLEEALPA